LKPSVAGLSFAVVSSSPDVKPTMLATISCAVYECFAVDEKGERIEGLPSSRSAERWQRLPIRISLGIELVPGERRLDLRESGAEGLELYVLVTPLAQLLTVTAAVANRLTSGGTRVHDEQQHFFQVELSVDGIEGGSFSPRPSRHALTDEDSNIAYLIYRDMKEYVVGHTCSARTVLTPEGNVASLKTEWIPVIEVAGTSDRGDDVFENTRHDKRLRPLNAEWLAQAPQSDLGAALRRIVESYRKWINSESQRAASLPREFRQQARKNVDSCVQGAVRMEEGISAIGTDANVRKAFQLAQETMRIQFAWQSGGGELVWHPFQIAFQLLAIPSLAFRDHTDRNVMDLLWFPTGGGKTEAYLALAAFVILLRRLRAPAGGDGSGVAVLMRYTLRLLTIQQFQRATAMICACELLRRRSESGDPRIPYLGGNPIGIGLWVGAAATPLTLKEASQRQANDPSTPEQLTSCPACGQPLHWEVTPLACKVECSADPQRCEFAASGPTIPAWTIDEEIYRHVPSLVIGTVDKFAQIVRKLDTQVLFGRGNEVYPPDLIIQDELHLISGPLGSIAGLYEVAVDELCRRDEVRPKIIGSTATIRRASEQARALFDRGTYQFPAPGLDAGNSGFAVTESRKPGRLYVGVTTAGRSATYMLQAITASLCQAATEAFHSEKERDYYWSLVLYFNSLRELGRALALMQDDVPISIRQLASRRTEQARKIDSPAELTSRVPSYEIRDMLDRLERHIGDPEAVDILLASNMISVGMNIPRLGMMLINSQPKGLSEYIQASSRVGRGGVPGLVVTMYNNSRPRDRSHYETFETWHRCLYRDVEATSVTPFAPRAQDKALHAVLVGLVRHTIAEMATRPVLDDDQRLNVERLARIIEQRAARVDPGETDAISRKLKHLLDEWASRKDLQVYWDDYGQRNSLLMSAEQYAAGVDMDAEAGPGGRRRALWPTPNSMREVEAAAPFVLVNVLKRET